MEIFFVFSFILTIIQYYFINCENIKCFEYSCEECTSENYGSCTKCRSSFYLIDGTCPCSDSDCAVCVSGLPGLSNCRLCKKGYYRMDNQCHCEVDNCEICEENGCKKCKFGYYYNNADKECQKYEEGDGNKITCFDDNCDICFSGEEGACDTCKDGFYFEKGKCIQAPAPVDEKCETGFYYNNNFCERICDGVECNDFYFQYNKCPINHCLVCQDNELKIFENCNSSDICQNEGCIHCITSDNCIFCAQGYYLIGGICKKCTYGCSLCTNDDTCEYCLSGFKLTSDKKCELDTTNNEFDFSLNKYNYWKYKLLKDLYKEEVTEIPNEVQTCDSNCNKCYDDSSKCLECNQLYRLENNKCLMHCSLANCEQCSLSFGRERCDVCEENYTPKYGKCVYNCSDPNCLSCYLLDGKELCTQCTADYTLENLQCKSRSRIVSIVFSIIVLLLIVIIIICFCYYRQKKINERHRYLRSRIHQENGINVIPYNDNSSQREINKQDILDEFEKMKSNMEKGNQVCQFCKKKPGKYTCDCGCVVCKVHSNLKKVEGDGESYKVCYNCEKIVKKVTPIKFDCNICMQKRINVVHFKCNCALVVCKDCYLKCRMESDNCPGCRAVISSNNN